MVNTWRDNISGAGSGGVYLAYGNPDTKPFDSNRRMSMSEEGEYNDGEVVDLHSGVMAFEAKHFSR